MLMYATIVCSVVGNLLYCEPYHYLQYMSFCFLDHSHPFISFLFTLSSSGWLCGGGWAASLLLPVGVLLDVSGGSAALQDGGPGLQHHLQAPLHDGGGLRRSCCHRRHLCPRQRQRIRNRAPVSDHYIDP